MAFLSRICSQIVRGVLPATASTARGFASRRRGPAKQKTKEEKQRVGKYKCHWHMPTPEKPSNNEKYSYNSRNAVTKHTERDHPEIMAKKDNYKKCRVCGNYCPKVGFDAAAVCDFPNCPKKAKDQLDDEEAGADGDVEVEEDGSADEIEAADEIEDADDDENLKD